jgi:oxygen-independent coproporphyrinogen-3 oxidase
MTAPASNGFRFGVYVHIPYCRLLCPYCDFVKKTSNGSAPESFTDALCREIESFEGPTEIGSVFFGGGTPSLLEIRDLDRILDALRAKFTFHDPEISFEVNPDDVTVETARAWKQSGINRVSLGVQSFDDDVLQYLGRLHDAERAKQACEIVSETFENWNIDLIFGARPADRWCSTLEIARAFSSTHISTYGLTYEPKTPFAKRTAEAVEDDVYVDLYTAAHAALNRFDHYEVSNYALPGFESIHNLIYWHNLEYAGFGPGAYSFVNGIRARNLPGVNDYLRRPGEKLEALQLSDYEVRVETLIQQFRLRCGLTKSDYFNRFNSDVDEDFGKPIGQLAARGLLERDQQRIFPTLRGFELNNEIGLALLS